MPYRRSIRLVHVTTKNDLGFEGIDEHARIRIPDEVVPHAAPLPLEVRFVRGINDICGPFMQKQHVDPLEFESGFDIFFIKIGKNFVAYAAQARNRRAKILEDIFFVDP